MDDQLLIRETVDDEARRMRSEKGLPDMPLESDSLSLYALGFDSLDLVELIARIEYRSNIVLEDSALEEARPPLSYGEFKSLFTK